MTLFRTHLRWFPIALFCILAQVAVAREWTDKTGKFKFEATLIAFDNDTVVLKVSDKEAMKGHELVSMSRKDLSQEDTDYLESKEAEELTRSPDKAQYWTMVDGTRVIGKAVDFVRKNVSIQRRRGNIYVNDRLYSNLPEIYRKIVPKVIEKYENVKLPETKDLEKWILTLRGAAKTYQCEGVILEFENGDEYAIPFFLFSENDLNALKPSWEQWVAAKEDSEQKRQNSLYMQSQAAAYQQNVQNQLAQQQQLAVAQLQMLAVAAGAVDLWQVYLSPGPGVMGYPINVVVTARDSHQASVEALNRNPGYIVGPIRRLASNR